MSIKKKKKEYLVFIGSHSQEPLEMLGSKNSALALASIITPDVFLPH